MRYFLSDIIGTGTKTDPYRLRISQYAGVAGSYLIPTDPVTGQPTTTWGLAAVRDQDWATLQADPNMTAFPNVAGTTLFGSLTTPQRNRINTWLTSHALAAATSNETIASIVMRIGLSVDPNFNVDLFTAG